MNAAAAAIVVLLSFGLGDVTKIIDSDEVRDAMDIAGSFSHASHKMTDIEEYYLGRSVAATVLDIYTPRNDPELQEYVNLVGGVVAFASPRPVLYNGYHFMVLDSDEINAIACPGGDILVCRGLLNLADNEDELAAILAHEVAHVALGHGVAAIGQARWMEFGTTVAEKSADRWGDEEIENAAEDYGDMVEDVVSTILTRGYGREAEYQADSLAVHILAAAGYAPSALSSVLEKMDGLTDRSGPGFWRTHPSPSDRLDKLEEVIAALPDIPVDPARTARFAEAIAARASSASRDRERSSTSPDGSRARGNTASERGSASSHSRN